MTTIVVMALFLLSQYGKIEEMNVCDNLGDHLVGNVYVKVNSHISLCVVNTIQFLSVINQQETH